MKRYKILLLGDYCLDVYYNGIVTKLNPEAPVPILSFTKKVTTDGMAGNVLKNFQQFPCDVIFHTTGKSTKSRFIDLNSGQHLLRMDDDPIRESLNLDLLKGLECDAVAISDYDKGTISYETIEYVLENFKVPIFIDTKKKDLAKFSGAFLKINQKEYEQATSVPDFRLIVTGSNKGVKYLNYPDDDYILEGRPVPVVDVCGCGDTFFASFIFRYLQTENVKQALEYANYAAAVTVQKLGAYAPSLVEISNLRLYGELVNRDTKSVSNQYHTIGC